MLLFLITVFTPKKQNFSFRDMTWRRNCIFNSHMISWFQQPTIKLSLFFLLISYGYDYDNWLKIGRVRVRSQMGPDLSILLTRSK